MPSPFAILQAPSAPTSGMGCNLLPAGGASFRVWAPNATLVRVLLRRDSSVGYAALPLALDPSNRAYHSADVAGVVAGDEYRFSIVNDPALGPDNPGGVFERVDPYARDVLSADAQSPALATAVPTLETAALEAAGRAPADYIIYQLHIGSFLGLNDGVAVVNRTATFRQLAAGALARIAALGFTAVEFLPTSEDPDSPEGYAPSNYFAPETNYGSPADLAFLVDECHRQDLAVIFDVVYNHAIADAAFDRLLQFDGNTVNDGRGIYFSTFDNFGPVPDFDRAEVCTFFVDNARQCFREYGADALRFDSSHAIRGRLRGWQPMADIVRVLRGDFPGRLLIAEHDNPSFAVNTLGFDASWQMGSGDSFVSAVVARDIGQLEDLLANPIGLPAGLHRVAYFLGSHDQIFADYESTGGTPITDKPFNRYFVERVGGTVVGRDQPFARALARVGWLLNLASPCIPMLFMGTECHHHGYWNPFLDAYGEHRLDHALFADAIGTAMVRFVTEANGLRAAHAAMRGPGWLTTHRDPQNAVLAFKRFDAAGDVLLFVVNLGARRFGPGGYGVGLAGDGGTWREIFNTQAPVYGGFEDSGNFGVALDGSSGTLSIALPEQSVIVLKKQ